MDRNKPKKWRKDYATLLKCYSMIKTSELLRECATNRLSSFVPEDKAFDRIQNYFKSIDSKSTLNQTIDLWQKTIEQFIKQNNFLAAAECLESLSEIQLSYGSEDQKNESLQSLMKASKFYKRASLNKRAIITIKKALTLIEFSQERDDNSIGDKYEECADLYNGLNLKHLSKLNQKIADFFGQITPYIKTRKETTVCVIHSTTSDSDSNESDSNESLIDCKELVQKQIKEMAKEYANTPIASTSSAAKDNESDYPNSDNNNEECVPICKNGSKQLLAKNLKNILSKSRNTSGFSSEENRSKITESKKLTTQITMAQQLTPLPSPTSVTTTKRKRKKKAKEDSEELPAKRLIKLNKNQIFHYFMEDKKTPETRLYCNLCKDSVLTYRWSIVIDHLESNKHKQLLETELASNYMDQFYSQYILSNQKNNEVMSYYDSNQTNYSNKQMDFNSYPMPSTSTQLPQTETFSFDISYDSSCFTQQLNGYSMDDLSRASLNTPNLQIEK